MKNKQFLSIPLNFTNLVFVYPQKTLCHLVENVLSVLAIGYQLGMPVESMIKTIKNFQAIKHRLEYLGNHQNIHYYNDSKSSNVQSSFDEFDNFEHRGDFFTHQITTKSKK